MNGSAEVKTRAEASVGTLVWVRRRNGSWWPGRILGPEELPGSHLLSPRSGTPVKLLGREDASVDWYNIQKSRRVKAFRCGEFDQCIEKAKLIAGLPTKKREKYARREDAILHALELERNQIQQNQPSGLLLLHKRPGDDKDQADYGVLDGIGQESDSGSDFLDSEPPTGAAESVVSFQKVSLNWVESGQPQGKQKPTNIDWDYDATEAIPRMRGLQDFGLRIASSKQGFRNWPKTGASVVPLTENDGSTLSCIGKSMAIDNSPNSSKGSSFLSKRKRSQGGILPDESTYKRRDRRRPLTQVLETSVKLAGEDVLEPGSCSKDTLLSSAALEEEVPVAPEILERKIKLLAGPCADSNKLESLSHRQDLDSHIHLQNVSGSMKDKFDTFSIEDNVCSSISDHLNGSCCNGRPMQFPSHFQGTSLAGSAFVDSLLRGSPLPTCSFYTGSLTTVDSTGLDDSSSISIPSVENFSYSPNFQLLSNNGIRETACSKFVNGLGNIEPLEEASWMSSFLPQSLNRLPSRSALPFSLTYTEYLKGHRSSLGKLSKENLESPFFVPASDLGEGLVKAPKTFPIQDPSLADKALRNHVERVDEGSPFKVSTAALDSFQRIAVIDTGKATKNEGLSVDGGKYMMETPAGGDLSCGLSTAPFQAEGLIKLHHLKGVQSARGLVRFKRNMGLYGTDFCEIDNNGNPSHQISQIVIDSAVSKWQAKGRRNARVLGKRQLDGFYGRGFTDSLDELGQGQEEEAAQDETDWKCGPDKKGLDLRVKSHDEVKPSNWLTGGDYDTDFLTESPYSSPHSEWESGQHVSISSISRSYKKSSCHDSRKSPGKRVMKSVCLGRLSMDGKQQLRYTQPNVAQMENNFWVEVPLEVRASYQGERVPLVSLMSRLNGKAIVGHPAVVEKLESLSRTGITEFRSRMKKFIHMGMFNGNRTKKTSLQPVWKTARRTSMLRVPRSCRSSIVGREDDDVGQSSQNQTGQPMRKVGFTSYLNRRTMLKRKSRPLIHRQSSAKKYSRKLLKRTCFYSPKTRTLSSIAVDQKLRPDSIESVSTPEPPLLTCIPVALVFSRIKEVLYGQSQPVVSNLENVLPDAFERQKPA